MLPPSHGAPPVYGIDSEPKDIFFRAEITKYMIYIIIAIPYEMDIQLCLCFSKNKTNLVSTLLMCDHV